MDDLNKLSLDKARTLKVELLKIKDSLTSDYPDAIRINDKMLEKANEEINRMERNDEPKTASATELHTQPESSDKEPDVRFLNNLVEAREKAEEEARRKVLGVSEKRPKIDWVSRRRSGNGGTGGGKRKRTKRRKSKRRKSKKRKGRKSKRRH